MNYLGGWHLPAPANQCPLKLLLPRQAKRALGAHEDSPRWARDTHYTSSNEGHELLGLPGMAPPERLGVDLDTLGRRKRITRELAWIKRILTPACTCQQVPSEVALGHSKIAHASPRTTQDRHKAESRARRARPRLLETGPRLAQDSSRHTQR